jgi:hypothetical protein
LAFRRKDGGRLNKVGEMNANAKKRRRKGVKGLLNVATKTVETFFFLIEKLP